MEVSMGEKTLVYKLSMGYQRRVPQFQIQNRDSFSPRILEAVNVERGHEPQVGRVQQRRHPLLLAEVGRQVLNKNRVLFMQCTSLFRTSHKIRS